MLSSLPSCTHSTTVHLQHRQPQSRSKKDQLSCCENSSPGKQVDEKCSFKRRYSPRWHFCSPWSNVLRELSLEAAHQLSLQLLKTPYQRKLINGALKAQSYHQVGGCSFHSSIWGMTDGEAFKCQMFFFPRKDLWIIFTEITLINCGGFFQCPSSTFQCFPTNQSARHLFNQFIEMTGEN